MLLRELLRRLPREAISDSPSGERSAISFQHSALARSRSGERAFSLKCREYLHIWKKNIKFAGKFVVNTIMNRSKPFLDNLRFIRDAFASTRREMVISLGFVVALTLLLAWIFYTVESIAQPDVFTSYFDAFVWAYTRYIEGGDGVFDGSPITVTGKIVASLFGFIGIAIVAIPAGLIGSGFTDAIEEKKREQQLSEYHEILLRERKLTSTRQFKEHFKTLPQDAGAWYSGCSFKHLGNNTRISKYELRGIDLKDMLDVCKRHPDFRVKNRASALSTEEENRADVYVLEHFPVNREYGCFINRGSKVTIVSTSSRAELNTGNFSFYLAKWAGFNYISKDFDADEEFAESYYNNPWREFPKVDGLTESERAAAGEKVSRELHRLYARKKALKEMFLRDLESVAAGEDAWVFCLLSHTPNKNNQELDIHLAHNTENGKHETVFQMPLYERMLAQMKDDLKSRFELEVGESARYPLIHRGADKERNLVYKLQEDGCRCSGLTMRVSAHLMEFDSNMRPALFFMAKAIKETLEPDRPLPADDVQDMNRIGHGFMPGKERDEAVLRKIANQKK